MSVSLARRLALLEAKLEALKKRRDIRIEVKDFGSVQENVEPGSYRLFPCPGGCGTQVRTGEARCSGCGEPLAWISPTTGDVV